MSIPGQDFRQAARWKSVALYVGFALYFVSFFLPAVDQWKGWDCAWLALEYWHDDKVSPLVLFGGLINPLGVLYLLVSALNAASKVRAYLAVAILFCIPDLVCTGPYECSSESGSLCLDRWSPADVIACHKWNHPIAGRKMVGCGQLGCLLVAGNP